MSGMVDWNFAVTLGAKVAGDGPEVTPEDAAAAVAELRADAEMSTGLVRDFTGLVAHDNTAPVLVVDRRGWVQANADGFATIIEPLIEKLAAKKGVPSALSMAIGSRVTGAEVGLLLGFLGSKVLGQFDPFHDPSGRLLLVAPNIVHVERELSADPTDFRLWVCLHEETHRVQFGANPWLAAWFRGQVVELLDDMLADPASSLQRLVEGLGRLPDILRAPAPTADAPAGSASTGLIDLVQTPEQKARLDALTAVMSLLEGHADVVMDAVGPSVVPTVAQIRSRFGARRGGTGPVDRAVRRLLGLDAKVAQYRDGARFVRAVTEQVGTSGFNAVWTGPETLPSAAELREPAAWVARVHA